MRAAICQVASAGWLLGMAPGMMRLSAPCLPALAPHRRRAAAAALFAADADDGGVERGGGAGRPAQRRRRQAGAGRRGQGPARARGAAAAAHDDFGGGSDLLQQVGQRKHAASLSAPHNPNPPGLLGKRPRARKQGMQAGPARFATHAAWAWAWGMGHAHRGLCDGGRRRQEPGAGLLMQLISLPMWLLCLPACLPAAWWRRCGRCCSSWTGPAGRRRRSSWRISLPSRRRR